MRLRWLSTVAALGLAAGCSFNGDGPSAGDGGPDTTPDTGMCVQACSGKTLITCDNNIEQRTTCALDCLATAAPHCSVLKPSNGAPITTLDVVPKDKPFVVPAGKTYRIDTGDGSIVDGVTIVRPPTLGGGFDATTGTNFREVGTRTVVLAVSSFTLENGATLTWKGASPNALIILSRGPVSIRGTIDFSAGCSSDDPHCAGPGGGAGGTEDTLAKGCSTTSAGGNGSGDPSNTGFGKEETGGGGGALAGAGGAGGDGFAVPTGAKGGRAGAAGGAGCPDASMSPLIGGSGGGAAGVGSGGEGGVGGGGGGAIQITSFESITVNRDDAGVATAVLNAGGDGGAKSAKSSNGGGGGGGSGGGILLEAPTITIGARAVLAANGGGGGAGVLPVDSSASDGSPGTLTTSAAPGGVGQLPDNAGGGGSGGAKSRGAGAGNGDLDGGGGGGGGVGIIRVNAVNLTVSPSGIVSPAHTTGTPAGQ